MPPLSSAHRETLLSPTQKPRSRARTLVALALALAGFVATAPALADARTEARRHFKAGMELVSKGNYAEGLKELEAAYEILPHPSVLFNIARAQAEYGNLDKAIAAYKNYV